MAEKINIAELLKAVLEAMEDLHRTGDTQVFDLYAAPELIPAVKAAIEQLGLEDS